MKVTIVQSIAGHADPRYELEDFSFRPGETVDLNDELAEAWLASGIAAEYKEPKTRNGRAPKSVDPDGTTSPDSEQEKAN